MKIAFLVAVALACLSGGASAQFTWDGTWRLEADQARASSRIYDIALQDGIYACRSCEPAWSVPADGVFHAVAGHSDFDETSVQLVDEGTVIFTRRLGGQDVYRAVDRISENGEFLAFSWTELSGAGVTIAGSGSWVRVTPAPSGAHRITGRWRELRPNSLSDNTLTFAIRTDGDVLHMTYGTGESWAARMGGAPAIVEGAPIGTSVAARRINDSAFEEVEMSDGRIVATRTSTLLDGSTMEIVTRDPGSGTLTRRMAHRR